MAHLLAGACCLQHNGYVAASRAAPQRALRPATPFACSVSRPAAPAALLSHGQRSNAVTGRRQRRAVTCSSGGDSGGKPTPQPVQTVRSKQLQQLKVQFELLGTLLVRYPALFGSLAVGAGYFLHLDALGNFHWNQHDALLGLQCALPIIALDSALMLPDYSPGTTTKVIKLKAPRAVAERLRRQEEENAAKAGAAGGQQQEQAGGSVSAAMVEAVVGEEQQAAEEEKVEETEAGPEGGSGGTAERADEDVGALLNAVIVVDQSGPLSVSVEQLQSSDDEAAAGTAGATPAATTGGAAVAAAVAGLAAKADEDMVDIEKTISIRAEQNPVLAALYRVQMEKAVDNVGRILPVPLEVVLLLAWHLAEEMLYRGIVLTWSVGWTIDRLYEAGADETVGLLSWQLATPQAGAVLAAVGCTTISLAVYVQRQLFPVRLIAKAEEELEASEVAEAKKDAARERVAGLSGGVPPQKKAAVKLKERQRMRKVLQKVKVGMVRQRKWSTAIEGTRDVVEWAAYSTSFLLTGNLLAPYLTAVSADLVFSTYQRIKSRTVERAQVQSMQTIQDLHKTAMALKEARRTSLDPKKADQQEGSGSGSSNGNGSSKGDAPAGVAHAAEEGVAGEKAEEKDAAPVGAGGSSSSSSSSGKSSKGGSGED